MIGRLQIEGMALIESLSIEFSPGFNVITGETGAGKSILIKALNFLTGGKATPDAIRKGFSAATVTGEFTVPEGHPALALLAELGIGVETAKGQAELLLRRQLTDKGRAQGWVNDQSVTNPTLRTLGGLLLDIFAQHENQRLMDEAEHLRYLDAFVKERTAFEQVQTLNRVCLDKLREIQTTVETFHERRKNRDYLEFRLEALRKFEPTAEDHARVQLLSREGDSQRKVHESLTAAVDALEGDGGGPARALREAARALLPLEAIGGRFAEVAALRTQAESLAAQTDDLSFELGKLSQGTDVDEGEMESAQERLFGYQQLMRKFAAPTVDALLEEGARLENELALLETAADRVKEAVSELSASARSLEAAAGVLSAARSSAAARVRQAVESELEELVMKGARFEIEFTPASRALPALDLGSFERAITEAWTGAVEILSGVGDAGAERGRFLLAANPGEPRLPLARIASGGEMSRILLALKKALIADAETCVLVFDEIDTGISGRVADVVGRKLRELAGNFQILCISHLPQVAVYADTHLLVKKSQKGDRTEAQIVALSEEESAREIARLLSGAKVDATSLAQAQNLKDKARGKSPKARAGSPKLGRPSNVRVD